MVRDKKYLADNLDFEAKRLEKQGLYGDAIEKRIDAAFFYIDLGLCKEAAYSFDRAGKGAFKISDMENAINYKLNAAAIFFHLKRFKDAAFSLTFASMDSQNINPGLSRETVKLAVDLFYDSGNIPSRGDVGSYLKRHIISGYLKLPGREPYNLPTRQQL